jgi:hypothetical protein
MVINYYSYTYYFIPTLASSAEATSPRGKAQFDKAKIFSKKGKLFHSVVPASSYNDLFPRFTLLRSRLSIKVSSLVLQNPLVNSKKIFALLMIIGEQER